MSEENLIADFDKMMGYICLHLCWERFYCEEFGQCGRCGKLEFRRKLKEYVEREGREK